VLGYRNLGLRVAAADLAKIAVLPGVVSVEPFPNTASWTRSRDKSWRGISTRQAPNPPGRAT
jgi:hypothetical protein